MMSIQKCIKLEVLVNFFMFYIEKINKVSWVIIIGFFVFLISYQIREEGASPTPTTIGTLCGLVGSFIIIRLECIW